MREIRRSMDKNIILNIVIIIFALFISSKIYKQQDNQLESLQRKNETEITRNDILSDISRTEKGIAAYKQFLKKRDASSDINDISNIAREAGVRILSIRPLAEERKENFIKMSFNLTLEAYNYPALGNFVSSLENSQNIYSIDNIDVKKQEEGSETLNVNLKISSIILPD